MKAIIADQNIARETKGYKLKGDGLQLTEEGKKERETRICVYETFYSQ